MQTYWIDVYKANDDCELTSNSSQPFNGEDFESNVARGKTFRLIDWNSKTLLQLLKQIVARRNVVRLNISSTFDRSWENQEFHQTNETVLDEVKKIITLPSCDTNHEREQQDFDAIVISENIVKQLNEFVSMIAQMYHNNSFHNFEHASHVTMSVVKLLSRIVAPSDLAFDENKPIMIDSWPHAHTYGITSDPLTKFACVLSALTHDIDHPGVTNTQLVIESTSTAIKYKNKSVAEQNSIDLALESIT